MYKRDGGSKDAGWLAATVAVVYWLLLRPTAASTAKKGEECQARAETMRRRGCGSDLDGGNPSTRVVGTPLNVDVEDEP